MEPRLGCVFVSYARKDAANAQAIAREIERAGFAVWIDQRLDSGSEYSREIEQALADACAVVVIWSRNSIDSAWVRDEAAEGRDSQRLVPVSIDGCRPPIGFRQFQTTDLSQWSGRGRPKQIDQVVAAIRAKSKGSPKLLEPPALAPRPRNLSIFWGAGALVALIGIAAFLLFTRANVQPTQAPSLAIAPFTADASDTDARKLASATRDAVAHTMSQGAFALSVLDAAPALGRAPADFLLTGHIRTTADKVIATVRIEETAHHYILLSHQWEESRDKAAELPDRIGVQVASQVSWTAPLIAIERRHPSDPAIAAAILGGSAAGLENVGALSDYERSRRLAAKAPDSPLAQNSFAFSTAFALDQIPRNERAEAVAAARRAVDRTIAIAPDFGSAYAPWCLLHSEQERAQCEAHLREGMQVNPDDPFANWFQAALLLEVGRDAEAVDLARLSYAHDPYMPHKIGLLLRSLEIAGQIREASELYQLGKRWWPNEAALSWRRLSGMSARGDFDAVARFQAEVPGLSRPTPDPVPLLAAAVKGNSLARARSACALVSPKDDPFYGTLCMLALSRLGNLDRAYQFADQLYPSRRGKTAADEDRIWLDNPDPTPTFYITGPGAAPLRRDRRFVSLASRLGLLEYWRSGHPPDFCRNRPEPICPMLVRAR